MTPSPTSSPSAPGRRSTSPTSRSRSGCSCSSTSTCGTPSGRRRPSPRQTVAEPELRLVHLDEQLAVVDKPAGLVVHPAPSHAGPTLVDELGEILGGGGGPERAGGGPPPGKGTSGPMGGGRGGETPPAPQGAGGPRGGGR